ncbi:MAG: glycosyltransferase, partial [Bacteroidota bacterium]
MNYNVKDLLLQCLRSVEQAKADLQVETIVVDNNSSDGSVAYLEPLFPDVRFIALPQNIGFGSANNVGIKQSTGKFVLILNPDTILEENTLKVMFEYMLNEPKAGIAGCKILNPDGTFQLACRRGFPSPWASFCKLFGLQKLFPKSKLFSQYNQTFRSEDETYFIDAVMGAFIFIRREVIDKIGGFDEDFFMYGEDLDLCYRTQKAGWEIAYHHKTSIIHYKGESTKRSSINEVKHFYQAMELFAKKHIAGSFLFLLFLRVGIMFRAGIAYFTKHSREFFVFFTDLIGINLSLIIATKIRFNDYFNFPEYAYPTVFIVLSCVLLLSMFAVGEYFERKISVRRAVFGLMISFFFLSSLTYFFNEYAFSRGVLLMTIGFTIAFSSVIRITINLLEKFKGKSADKRIAIIGMNTNTEEIISSLQSGEVRNAKIIGLISVDDHSKTDSGIPVLGNIEYLPRLIEQYKLQEIIITDTSLTKNDLMTLVSSISSPSVRFQVAQEYEQILTARIIEDISGVEPTVPKLEITNFRNRLVKRAIDIILSFLSLTAGIIFIYIFSHKPSDTLKKFWFVLIGKLSIIGIFPVATNKTQIAKPGIMSLAQLSDTARIPVSAIINLNNYYIENYSFSL